MSFTLETFSSISSHGNSNSPNSWTYRTEDTLAEVTASGYFQSQYNIINNGDLIVINAVDFSLVGFFTLSGNDFVVSAYSPSSNSFTGWAQYSDDSLSSGSPQVVNQGSTAVITNNAANVIESQLPIGVSSLYDGLKIRPDQVGDAYMIRVNFDAFTSVQSGFATLELDIGAPQNVILKKGITFPKGAGLANAISISTSNLVYTLGTFIANGGELKLVSNSGNTSIYNVSYVISRIHKGF